jgi:alcohol dehydrogenase class IV
MIEFVMSKIPPLIVGPNKWLAALDHAKNYGKNVLMVIGHQSLEKAGKLGLITTECNKRNLTWFFIKVPDEPTPSFIDRVTAEARIFAPHSVIAIGGGSVMDAGKAISAMIPLEGSVTEYLEGVGTKMHPGTKIPFIAIPTTSGTGSEATKNAVLRNVGENGYKKSLRHDNFIPDLAIIDPELLITCPIKVTAACGLDALTQLMEGFVSTKANPFTDALALSGLQALSQSLFLVVDDKCDGMKTQDARTKMAYAAFLSGVVLANAGLGIVHGIAGPIGGFVDIPHGVACGNLIAEAARMNIQELQKMGEKGEIGLYKHAQIGAVLSGNSHILNPANKKEIEKLCEKLILQLEDWITQLKIPRLSEFGIDKKLIQKIVAAADGKNNPVKLSKEQVQEILEKRL